MKTLLLFSCLSLAAASLTAQTQKPKVTLNTFNSPYTTFATAFPHQKGYVNDYYGLLSEGAVENLTDSLKEFRAKTHEQLVVAIMGVPYEVQKNCVGRPSCSYAHRLAVAWHIGENYGDRGGGVLVIFPGRTFILFGGTAETERLFGQSTIAQDIIYPIEQKDWQDATMKGLSAIMNELKQPSTVQRAAK